MMLGRLFSDIIYVVIDPRIRVHLTRALASHQEPA